MYGEQQSISLLPKVCSHKLLKLSQLAETSWLMQGLSLYHASVWSVEQNRQWREGQQLSAKRCTHVHVAIPLLWMNCQDSGFVDKVVWMSAVLVISWYPLTVMLPFLGLTMSKRCRVQWLACLLMLSIYRIAGIFHGWKLLNISQFRGNSQKFLTAKILIEYGGVISMAAA